MLRFIEMSETEHHQKSKSNGEIRFYKHVLPVILSVLASAGGVELHHHGETESAKREAHADTERIAADVNSLRLDVAKIQQRMDDGRQSRDTQIAEFEKRVDEQLQGLNKQVDKLTTLGETHSEQLANINARLAAQK